MIPAKRTAVRPRVVPPTGGEPELLEDVIALFVRVSEPWHLVIEGPAGSGKTTALRHAAAMLPPGYRAGLLDELKPAQRRSTQWICRHFISTATEEVFSPYYSVRMAPWTDDDLIEYLLAVHKPRCTSVMARLTAADRIFCDGLPDVWCIVLNALAADESLPDGRTALHRHIAAQLPDTDLLERARSACLNTLTMPAADRQPIAESLVGFPSSMMRLLRHDAVQKWLAAERIAADLQSDAACDCLALRLPRELVRAAVAAIGNRARAVEHLKELLAGPPWSHAMAASLLHAMDRAWVPMITSTAQLAGAYLDHACWPDVQLEAANLADADLNGADLCRANLDEATIERAKLARACLREADLRQVIGMNADLREADLGSVRASSAAFADACLLGANLEDAVLRGASFVRTDLRNANLAGADLGGSNLQAARIEGADFTAANLQLVCLDSRCLREACFTAARFLGAGLKQCDMEFMDLADADFAGANLEGALLTGSVTRGANFRGANLSDAKLADVDWEGAVLCNADLRGASFHMGSTRSGLVGSVIPCEGSRTGFYTDDFEEQYFKAPEEVRKANLCGADLRGARIDDVDFYLVDLRGAFYNAEQEAHFRRCKAILGTPV